MLYILLAVLISLIFHQWFMLLPISGGDLTFFFREQLQQYFNPPFMWEPFYNLGLGGDSFIHQGLYLNNLPLGILAIFFDFTVGERIVFLYPILLIGFFAPIFLGKILKLFDLKFSPLASLIFFLNTYALMIIGGGQITVALGYVTIPLAFAIFITAIENFKVSKILLFSLVFSFLIAFDFRYVYMFLVILIIYSIFLYLYDTSIANLLTLSKKYIIIFSISILVVFVTQAYWLLPYVSHFYNPAASAGNAYMSTGAVEYFSFATFENSFSLLHPLWPENIFGKVGFMKPEFLILPLLAFLSLFFTRKREKSNIYILFFAFLGIIGAFLAKGTNEPFGQIYVWAFLHIPGFVMFRDPTKWYTLVALAYSILIPFSIWKIYEWFRLKKKFSIFNFQFSIKSQVLNFQNAFLLLITLCLLFLIHPAILGKLGGTLKTVTVPKEYVEYKNFLISQKSFSRVLWVPTLQRFTFYSNEHPAIPGGNYFNTYDEYGVVKNLQGNSVQKRLQEGSVKYVVVPSDTQKEIFIKDRKYDERQYHKTVEALKNITWLREVKRFGKIVVFEINNPKAHFWSNNLTMLVQGKAIDPTKYEVKLHNGKKDDLLVFSESYDNQWLAKYNGNLIQTKPYNKLFNSFRLPQDGNYTLTVYYQPQKWVNIGLLVSGVSFFSICLALLFLVRQKK